MKPDISNFIFTLLLSGCNCYFYQNDMSLTNYRLTLIPAATARSLSSNPLQMVILSILVELHQLLLVCLAH